MPDGASLVCQFTTLPPCKSVYMRIVVPLRSKIRNVAFCAWSGKVNSTWSVAGLGWIFRPFISNLSVLFWRLSLFPNPYLTYSGAKCLPCCVRSRLAQLRDLPSVPRAIVFQAPDVGELCHRAPKSQCRSCLQHRNYCCSRNIISIG